MSFTNQLIAWYLDNKRDLPWRNTLNPYKIWLSEIILQQTRVAQGLPYFEAFVSNFPTILDLANAQETQVLKLWQGLGYYSRARNLHETAKHIAYNLNSKFPENYIELQKLKGIGSYTAAAIASFAFQEKVAVVDGNVYRVLSRFFGNSTNIATAGAKKEFFAIAQTLIPAKNPAVFNQAIMEFGALQCVPKNPNCMNCVLKQNCVAFATNQVVNLPVNIKNKIMKHRFLNYFLVLDANNKIVLNKRTQKGIWQNLYELPCIETEKFENDLILNQLINQKFEKIVSITQLTHQSKTHKLTHQHLHLQFFKIKLDIILNDTFLFSEALKKPFPIVLYNFLEDNPF